jgi:RND superfamily putative drug exporter
MSADRVPDETHAEPSRPSHIARFIRRLPVLVVVAWLALTALVNVIVPQLEEVGKAHSVSLAAKDAQSYIAIKKQGANFEQFDSDSMVMVLLESDDPLGDDARDYYHGLVAKFRQDSKHVEYVQDFWGDRITAGGAQSMDDKAAYVQLNLVGDQGTTAGKESVRSVRDIVEHSSPPPGLHVYVTGQAALTMDMNEAGDKSMLKMTAITFVVITIMLFLIYRSITTVLLILFTVFVELGAARGMVAFLGYHQIMGLSTFAVNLLTSLAIAAGTDYAIFFIGRYQEARAAGQDRISAYFTTYHSVSHVVLGSGLTIAGATFCLKFTRLPYFESLGVPCAVGMLVVVAAALTITPAVLLIGTRFGLLESKRKLSVRGWRRIGTAIVRWPGPILLVTMVVALVGLGVLPSYSVNYNDQYYIPDSLPSIQGYQASYRHFSKARMNPDILLLEANQDLRTPGNMLVLDRIAKNLFRVEGIDKVQSITRPLGSPIDHSSVPFQVSMQSVPITENLHYLKERMADLVRMTDELGEMIAILERMQGLMQELAETTHDTVGDTEAATEVTDDIRDSLADFDDFWRPIRNYFYWEPHCFDIPICWSLRSIYGALDGIDQISEKLHVLLGDLEHLDSIQPQLVAQLPPMIAISKDMRDTLLTMYSTFNGLINQMERMTDTATVMGQAFDAAKNDDFFYLPPEAFDNADFQKGLKLMVSPDGKSAQFIVTHEGDPAGNEALAKTGAELTAAKEAIKGSPLQGSRLYVGGTAPTYHDIGEFVKYDLMLAVVASLSLILIIMLVITRSIVAALTIVGTIGISLGSSFGLSVLLWQHLLGLELHWFVLPFTVIILLAVGSDYNLLLVSRFKEELGGGLKTSIIRGVGGSGSVATQAGLVFAFTMGSMITSDLRAIGQSGSAICLGLLFDTFIIRAFMTPSIAALLGRWFWWPIKVLPTSTISRSAVEPDHSAAAESAPVR